MFQTVTANDIELKYDSTNLDITWDYIGPDRTKGDCYYEPRYLWVEHLDFHENKPIYSKGTPNAIVCLTENAHLVNSIHIAVFEVFKGKRGAGLGTRIIQELIALSKELKYVVITLQARDKKALRFWKKMGFGASKIDGVPFYRLFI